MRAVRRCARRLQRSARHARCSRAQDARLCLRRFMPEALRENRLPAFVCLLPKSCRLPVVHARVASAEAFRAHQPPGAALVRSAPPPRQRRRAFADVCCPPPPSSHARRERRAPALLPPCRSLPWSARHAPRLCSASSRAPHHYFITPMFNALHERRLFMPLSPPPVKRGSAGTCAVMRKGPLLPFRFAADAANSELCRYARCATRRVRVLLV